MIQPRLCVNDCFHLESVEHAICLIDNHFHRPTFVWWKQSQGGKFETSRRFYSGCQKGRRKGLFCQSKYHKGLEWDQA